MGQQQQQVVIVGEEHCAGEDRELTVRKTTLFTPGDGLEAYDHRTGALAFRVETYGRGGACGGGAAAGDLALLDAEGEPVLTVRRRRPSLHNRWDGFLGDGAGHQKPLFSARRSSILGAGTGAAAVLVDLLAPGAAGEFHVDGSFPRRCCRVVASARAWGGADGGEAPPAEKRRGVRRGGHAVSSRAVALRRQPLCSASPFALRLRRYPPDASGTVKLPTFPARPVPCVHSLGCSPRPSARGRTLGWDWLHPYLENLWLPFQNFIPWPSGHQVVGP